MSVGSENGNRTEFRSNTGIGGVGGAIAATTFTVTLSVTSVAVAVPTLTRSLGAGTVGASLLVIVPPLASTVFLLPCGRVSDIVGRRRCYVAAILLFTAVTVAIAVSNTIWLIVALQAVQGIAVAAVWANSAALLFVSLAGQRFRVALGFYIGAISVADLAGPTVGGAITDAFGWRWIFGMTAIAGTVCSLWNVRVIPHSPPTSGITFDVRGAALMIAGLTGLVGGLLAVQASGAIGFVPAAAGVAGVAALTALRYVERHQLHPILDLQLFTGRYLRMAMTSGVLNAAAQWAPSLLLVLFFQAHDGMSAAFAGLHAMPLTVAAAVSSAAMGGLTNVLSVQRLALGGSALAAIGLLCIAAGLGATGLLLDAGEVCLGCGTGIFSAALADVLMQGNAPEAAGAVNGARLTAQNLGWVVATPVALAITTGWLHPAQRHSFFAGRVEALSPHANHLLLLGSRLAFLGLAGFAVCGTALAWTMVRAWSARLSEG